MSAISCGAEECKSKSGREISGRIQKVFCDFCSSWYHRICCPGLTPSRLSAFIKTKTPYKCSKCYYQPVSNSISLLPIDKSLSGFASNDSIDFQSQFRTEQASILPLSPNSIVNDDVAFFNDSFSLKLDSDDDLDYGQQPISNHVSSNLVLVNLSTVNHTEKGPPLSTHVSEHSHTHFPNIEYASCSDYSNAAFLGQVASVISQSLSILSDDGGNFDISNHLVSNTLAIW
jgi:hypothetical protein